MNTQELATVDEFSRQISELQTLTSTCRKLMETKHYASMGESGIHTIIARAKSLGIHPFEALNGGFYCVQGKVGMSTEMMAALIRRKGHSITKDPKSNNELVILHGKRADNGDTWTCSFSKDDAIQAGLWSGATWKKYPAVMLYNRCMSMLFRQLFPDLSMGAGYVEDEIREITKTGDYSQLPEADFEVKNDNPFKGNKKKKVDEIEVKSDEKITQEEFREISLLLEEADEDFREKIMKGVKKSGYDSLESVTPAIYVRVKTATLAHINEKELAKEIYKDQETIYETTET